MDELVIHFRLTGAEARALSALALAETRRPQQQVRHIVRTELIRLGLLQAVAKPNLFAPQGECGAAAQEEVTDAR
jgi:hypothetical protein